MKFYPLLIVLLCVACLGDVVELNDGSKVEGTIKRESGGWEVTQAGGKVVHLQDSEIKLIEKGNPLSPAEQANVRLASLRKGIDALSDIGVIIDRLNKFIDQNKAFPAADEAKKDLADWKEKQEKKLVKIAGKWVTPEEQAAMMGKVVGMVDEARDLVKQGRLREAEASVNKLLAMDANNVSGLYLKGVLSMRQDNIAEAAKAFEKVRDLLPDHAPTLNNLAVLMFRRKPRQTQGAVALLDMAMMAAPKSRAILDNMYEAKAALTKRDLANVTVKRALQHLAEQDAELAAQLKQQGLFRWGSSWVNKEQMDEVAKARDKIKDKLEAVKAEYEQVEARLRTIDDTMEANDRELARIDRDRTMTNNQGVSMQLPRPSAYYTLRRDNERLKSEETSLVGKLDEIIARGQKIQQEMPFPEFTGAMKIIDVEGTPLVLPAGAPKGTGNAKAAAQ
jgi:tetratricopeptide (TPR) repeat protein